MMLKKIIKPVAFALLIIFQTYCLLPQAAFGQAPGEGEKLPEYVTPTSVEDAINRINETEKQVADDKEAFRKLAEENTTIMLELQEITKMKEAVRMAKKNQSTKWLTHGIGLAAATAAALIVAILGGATIPILSTMGITWITTKIGITTAAKYGFFGVGDRYLKEEIEQMQRRAAESASSVLVPLAEQVTEQIKNKQYDEAVAMLNNRLYEISEPLDPNSVNMHVISRRWKHNEDVILPKLKADKKLRQDEAAANTAKQKKATQDLLDKMQKEAEAAAKAEAARQAELDRQNQLNTALDFSAELAEIQNAAAKLRANSITNIVCAEQIRGARKRAGDKAYRATKIAKNDAEISNAKTALQNFNDQANKIDTELKADSDSSYNEWVKLNDASRASFYAIGSGLATLKSQIKEKCPYLKYGYINNGHYSLAEGSSKSLNTPTLYLEHLKELVALLPQAHQDLKDYQSYWETADLDYNNEQSELTVKYNNSLKDLTDFLNAHLYLTCYSHGATDYKSLYLIAGLEIQGELPVENIPHYCTENLAPLNFAEANKTLDRREESLKKAVIEVEEGISVLNLLAVKKKSVTDKLVATNSAAENNIRQPLNGLLKFFVEADSAKATMRATQQGQYLGQTTTSVSDSFKWYDTLANQNNRLSQLETAINLYLSNLDQISADLDGLILEANLRQNQYAEYQPLVDSFVPYADYFISASESVSNISKREKDPSEETGLTGLLNKGKAAVALLKQNEQKGLALLQKLDSEKSVTLSNKPTDYLWVIDNIINQQKWVVSAELTKLYSKINSDLYAKAEGESHQQEPIASLTVNGRAVSNDKKEQISFSPADLAGGKLLIAGDIYPDMVGKVKVINLSLDNGATYSTSLPLATTHFESALDLAQDKSYSLKLKAALISGGLSLPYPHENQYFIVNFSADRSPEIRLFYDQFKAAYEARNDSQIMSYIDDNWQAGDGTTLVDLQNTLRNNFNLYNEIKYEISNLNINKPEPNRYLISYDLTISGKIYDNNLQHEEKSSVSEELAVDPSGKIKIMKTLNGRFWYIH